MLQIMLQQDGWMVTNMTEEGMEKCRVMSSDGQMEGEAEQIFRWMGRWMDGRVVGWKTAN